MVDGIKISWEIEKGQDGCTPPPTSEHIKGYQPAQPMVFSYPGLDLEGIQITQFLQDHLELQANMVWLSLRPLLPSHSKQWLSSASEPQREVSPDFHWNQIRSIRHLRQTDHSSPSSLQQGTVIVNSRVSRELFIHDKASERWCQSHEEMINPIHWVLWVHMPFVSWSSQNGSCCFKASHISLRTTRSLQDY